ncbi:hypothetical protein [Persephonella sp.]
MRYPKTRYQRLTLTDFTGGLNTERSDFDIADNEFKVFQNLIYKSGGPRTRGGFQIEYGFLNTVLSALKRDNLIYLIFNNGDFGVYDTQAKTYTSKGTITDTITIIPKMEWFDPAVVFTVGDSVWVYDTQADALTKTSSPVAKDLLVKYGRVAIASGDEVWFSRVGDATDWAPNSNDPSAAQYFQIGYKEGKPITAINHFLDDLLVFKEDRIYQLIGMSSVQLLNSKRGAINNSSTISLMSDVYAVDKEGFYSVVKDRFVDVVAGDLDLKVKRFLKDNIDTSLRVFYSQTLRAFIIKGFRETLLYFYEYGSFGTFKTELPIDVIVDDGTLYGLKDNIYLYKEDIPYDSFSGYIADDNQEIASDNSDIYEIKRINSILKSKSFQTGLKTNVIRFGFSIKDIADEGNVSIQVGKKTVNVSIQESSGYIYNDTGYIADDNSLIFGMADVVNKHKHSNQVVDSFYFYVSTDTPATINNLFADYIPMEA